MFKSCSVPARRKPSPPSSIAETEVTCDSLLSALRNVFIDTKIDEDGDLCVTDGLKWPIWIKLDREARVVELHSYVEFAPENMQSLGAIANRCNANYCYAQFYAQTSKNRIHASAFYFYDDMILLKQFERLMRYFASTVYEAAYDELLVPSDDEARSEVINLY